MQMLRRRAPTLRSDMPEFIEDLECVCGSPNKGCLTEVGLDYNQRKLNYKNKDIAEHHWVLFPHCS